MELTVAAEQLEVGIDSANYSNNED
jgi:hypothetical protein